MIKLNKLAAAKAVMALGLAVFGSGCMSLENEEGRLPDAMRSAISGLTAKGYPDLTKIPDTPKDMPSPSTWSALESRLSAQGREVARNPNAVSPRSEETNLDWAAIDRAALESDPRAEPLPPVVAGALSSQEWAEQARAKLDADIARLPPL